MAALNKNFTKWLIIISIIIVVVFCILFLIKLLPFIVLLLVLLWIYSKITKFLLVKKNEKQRKAQENNFTDSNNIPNSDGYSNAVEIDKDKVIDVEFVEEKKKE